CRFEILTTISLLFSTFRFSFRFTIMIKSFSVLLIFTASFSFAQTKDYSGFTASSAQIQKQWEARYDSQLHASDVDQFIKVLSAHPHHVGSPGDRDNANWILQQFKSWGFDARIDTFYVLFPTPKFRLLEAVSPIKYKAVLAEPPLKEDATSNQTKEQLP